jgi:hypothetical protein
VERSGRPTKLAAVLVGKPSLPAVLAFAASLIALVSAWHSGGHMWRQLDGSYRTYAPLSSSERRHAALDRIEVPGAIFDFYASYISRGDRVYFQVMPSGLSHDLDLPSAVAAAGRFYLLPAVQTENLADATVVVSYFADPNTLPVHYITQQQAGVQPLYVSRIRPP